MALQKQVVTIDLGFGGIDQKTDGKRVIPTRLTDAYNVRFDKTGRISRRYGYDVLGSTTLTFSRVIQSHDQIIGIQPLSVSMGNTWVKSANSGWSNSSQTARRLPIPEIRFETGIAPTAAYTNYSNVDSAVGSNYTAVFATNPSTSMAAFILSNTTGKIVDTFPVSMTRGRVLCLSGDNFLFGGVVGTSINFVKYDASGTSGAVNATFTVPFVTGSMVWDWTLHTTGVVSLAMGADINTAISTQRLAAYVPDTSVTFLSYTSVTTSTSVGIASFSNSAIATFNHSSTKLKEHHSMTVSSPATLTFVTGTQINFGTGNDIGRMGMVFSPSGLTINYYAADVGLIVGTSITTPFFISITANYTLTNYVNISKPAFLPGIAEPLVWIIEQNGTTPYLYRNDANGIVGKAIAEQCYWSFSINDTFLTSLNASSSGLRCALSRLNTATSAGGIYGVGIADISFDQNKHVQGNINKQAYITGGFLATTEAPGLVNEAGALTFPNVSDAVSVSTGGNLPVGSYSLVATYERYDRRGDRMISQVSFPVTLSVTTATGRISVTSSIFVPSMFGDWQRKFYMTAANGTIYYSVTTSSNFIVTVSSASEPIYTTGNVIENYQPSCPIAFATNGRRAICVEGDNPNFVLISKEKGQRSGLTFMQDIGRQINSYGGSIVDLKAMNDKWIAFKNRSVFAASGEGPDDTGQNDTMSEFELVYSSIGCINKRTSVLTNYGIVFMSERGFYMLGSGLDLTPVGLPVIDIDQTTIISGAFSEKTNELHYLVSNGTTLTLTFFETENGLETRWSRNTNQPFADIVVVDGTLNASLSVPVSTMSVVNKSTTFYDNQSTTYSPYVIETAWIPMGSLQGFGRLYEALFLGNASNTSFTASVQIGYDYADYSETKTITGANATAGTSQPQWTIRTDRQKCESVRFKLTMNAANEGFQFNQIQLVIGIKGGANKMRSEKAGS